MENYYNIDYSLIKKYIKDKYKIVSSEICSANIYKIGDEIIKLYDYYLSNYDKYSFFCQIKVDSFAFPNKLITNNNYFRGYTMKFAKGQTFRYLSHDILLSDFLKSFENIENDLEIISSNNIRIFDLHDNNILYDKLNKKITIIDTDDYSNFVNFSYDELLKKNIYAFKCVVKSLLFPSLDNIDELIFNSETTALEAYKKVLIYLEEYYNKQIITIHDLDVIQKEKKLVLK